VVLNLFNERAFAQGLFPEDDGRIVFVEDMELAIEYETNGLFARIIDAPAEEAVKHGFELGGLDEDVSGYIFSKLDEIDGVKKMTDAMSRSRLFGGVIVVMMVDDGKGLEEPLEMRNVHRIVDLRVYDRTEAVPDYSSALDYHSDKPRRAGTPEFYDVHLAFGGGFRVHESRCLIFTNGKLASQSIYQQYLHWGLPEYYRIAKPLRDLMKAHDMTTKMLEKSVQPVYKGNLRGTLSAAEGEQRISRRLSVINRLMGRFRYIGIDKETEDITFAQSNVAGVQEAITAAANLLSAASGIPQTILFGRSPVGMNATGEADLENWYSLVERKQMLCLKPNILKLLDVIVEEGLFSRKIRERPEIKLEFVPLWSMSEREQAEIDCLKAQTDDIKAKTAELYCKIGALEPEEVREGLEGR